MTTMIELNKVPAKAAAAALAVCAVLGGLLWQNARLSSNLKSSTKITQSLREQLEQLRQENQSYMDKTQKEQSQLDNLSTEVNSLRQDKSVSTQRESDMKKLVDDAEQSLENQNRKVRELQQQLQNADEKIRRQKKASASLEQQTRSARANPAMTPEYVKLVEGEWAVATQKTEELKKELQRTLSALSGQNRERDKLRSDTATMHYNLAVILTEQQNYPAAVREYEKVLEIRPNDADAHYNLAIIYDDYVRDNRKALAHYRQYVKAVPDAPEAERVRQWIKDREFDDTFKMKV